MKTGFDIFDIYMYIVDDKYDDRCQKMCDSAMVVGYKEKKKWWVGEV